ncbi:13348_t:CDS:2, partial [Ambispora gerdemannii]
MNITNNNTENNLSFSNHENPILENLFGYAGTALLSIQLLPQVYKSWKRKSTKGLSSAMMLLWGISSVLFSVYSIGVSLSIPILLQPQLFGLLCLICHVQCLYYSSNKYHKYGHEKDNDNKVVNTEENNIDSTTTTVISDNERKLKLRNHQIKCVILFSLWILLFAAIQTGGIFCIKKSRERNISWPEHAIGILALVLALIGFLPQFYVIFLEKRVHGISFIFTIMDMVGSAFELLSLVFAPPPFNVLAS